MVLLRPSMRNSFNLLLLLLAAVDSAYLALSVAEAARMRFLPHESEARAALTRMVPVLVRMLRCRCCCCRSSKC